jgi:hypothetical protein
MNKNIYNTIVAAAAGVMTMLSSNFAIANPDRGGGNCNSCHTASSPPSSLTISPNPIDIKLNNHGLLTLQVTSMGTLATAVISVQGLENALLNATVNPPPPGGHWTHATGTGGTSWLSDYIYGTGPYTMDLAIGASATTGTYPITVRFAGLTAADERRGSSTSFNLMISPAGVPGDYNGNGVVDAADYVLWRNNGPLQNEVDTPGTVNAADYTAWKARFGNTSGAGSLSFAIGPIPEPATVVLAVIGLLVIYIFPSRRH